MAVVQPQGVSAIIVNWNGIALLEECLAALARELDGEDAEIIVVDNASTDGSVEWLRTSNQSVTIVETGANVGFAAGCNAGARAARFDILAFVNNDAIVQPGWRTPLETAIRAEDDVVIAGGLALFRHDPSLVNSAGVRVGRSCAGTDIGFELALETLDLATRDVAAVSGVSMAVDADWFCDTGGFDEDFFMYFEDVELGLRAWLEGRRVVFVPDSVVLHAFGGTAGSRYSPTRNYYASRNRVLSAFRVFDGPALMSGVALSIAEDVAVLGMLAARRDWPHLRATLRGKSAGTWAGLRDGVRRWPIRKTTRARFCRSNSDLAALGVIDPLRSSLREFMRFRRL